METNLSKPSEAPIRHEQRRSLRRRLHPLTNAPDGVGGPGYHFSPLPAPADEELRETGWGARVRRVVPAVRLGGPPRSSREGSFVIDLGGVYVKGRPVRSLYNYRLLIELCDRQDWRLAEEFFWFNPSKLPSPVEWVNCHRFCNIREEAPLCILRASLKSSLFRLIFQGSSRF